MVDPLVDGLVRGNCHVTSTLGPAHVSRQLAEKLAKRTQRRCEVGRSERIYQLARVTHTTPPSGRLELAMESDSEQLLPWMRGFVSEAGFELGTMSAEDLLGGLMRERALYIWEEPGAVSMAGFSSPTAHGASINFVYTLPEFRGRGYAKSVVAALASRMLASGLSYCFIATDADDARTNRLYQAVGARTLCELLRCTIERELR
jgi:predicted GNAT family acetyltransferase